MGLTVEILGAVAPLALFILLALPIALCQLRDAMGLRASFDIGDPWPAAEKQLLDLGFRWQMMGGQRVMYLKEKDGFEPDTGWQEAEEYNDNEL